MAAIWSEDNLRPTVSTPLGSFDNYEIYDLVLSNASETTKFYNYTAATVLHRYRNQTTRFEYFPLGVPPLGLTTNFDLDNPTAPAVIYGGQHEIGGNQFVLWYIFEGYQEVEVRTTPERLILADTITAKLPPRIYAVQRYTHYGAANTELIYNLFDEFIPLASSQKISWEQLIINDDIIYSGIAQESGSFQLEYWSENYLENHPLINHTLDYRKVRVRLTTGQPYKFTLRHPVAHSITADAALWSAVAVNKPPIADLLFSNRNYANTLTVATTPVTAPPSGITNIFYAKEFYDYAGYLNSTIGGGSHLHYTAGLADPDNPPEPPAYRPVTYTWHDYRVLRATNRVVASTWGANAEPGDYPAISPPQADQWHFAPQSDNSNGSIIMDSIRTIETLEFVKQIADAIDATKYATDPETSLPRVANLGHLIEKVANFIGYRPEPNGSIDIEKEKTTYAATVVKGDFVGGTDYHAGRFGQKGMFIRRLPNKLGADGKWEPGGIVKVHDLPQLHTELFGQLNQALNLQDSTSINIRDGSKTYSYPNQLALLTEIGTGVIQHRRQIREIWASSIVTQKTVNEVLAGFGLPVVSKALTLNGQQLPYWGIQPNQSLQKEIATSTYQGGAQLGQLL